MRRIRRGTLVGILIGMVSGLGAISFNFPLHTRTRFFTHDLIVMILQGASGEILFAHFPLPVDDAVDPRTGGDPSPGSS
jgi:hypothetical protein